MVRGGTGAGQNDQGVTPLGWGLSGCPPSSFPAPGWRSQLAAPIPWRQQQQQQQHEAILSGAARPKGYGRAPPPSPPAGINNSEPGEGAMEPGEARECRRRGWEFRGTHRQDLRAHPTSGRGRDPAGIWGAPGAAQHPRLPLPGGGRGWREGGDGGRGGQRCRSLPELSVPAGTCQPAAAHGLKLPRLLFPEASPPIKACGRLGSSSALQLDVGRGDFLFFLNFFF